MDYSKVITKEQCQKALERYTGGKNFEIKSYTVNPLESLDGLMCSQYFLKITYQTGEEESNAQLFFKILIKTNAAMYELSKSFRVFEKEIFYYETVVPMLRSKGLSVDYVPKSYFGEHYLLVLEDLTLRSYKGPGKSKPLDLPHCKKGLETLAKFHADPIVYELERSKELGQEFRFADHFRSVLEEKYSSRKDSCATKFVQCSVRGLFYLVDLIPENGVTKDEFKTALENILEMMLSMEDQFQIFRSTFLHGDLWSNNFLYNYDKATNEINDCIVIDFQFLKYGPPAFDVVQFLYTNTRKGFRDQHQSELTTHYYNFFSDVLTQKGYKASKVLSEGEFRKSCEACTLLAKTLAVMDRSITFLSDDSYEEASKDEETFARYLYEDRKHYVVKGFNNNSEFRELMIEDLTELRDMIFARQ